MKSKKLAVILGGMIASVSVAGTALAESCYQLKPFVDVLRLDVKISEDAVVEKTHHQIHGSWIAPGYYSMPFTGSREPDMGFVTTPNARIIGGIGANNTTNYFYGNLICGLNGRVNGPWTVQCSGGSGGNFSNSGTQLTKVSCDTQIFTQGAPETMGGKPVGG